MVVAASSIPRGLVGGSAPSRACWAKSIGAPLVGIRATQRGETPGKPREPFLLRDVSTILLDCGIQPEECFRLRWEHCQDDTIEIT